MPQQTRPPEIIFISSRQNELQNERDSLRNFINNEDEVLRGLFVAKAFESDLAGRKESVDEMTEDGVLRSDIYLGLFDREYSQPTVVEYETARNDRFVRKEFLICIRERPCDEREERLREFLSVLMDPKTGYSCIMFHDTQDLLAKVKNALLNFLSRTIEEFPITEDFLGPNLDRARSTSMPEKLRRGLLWSLPTYMVHRGRKGVRERYRFDESGNKIDVTWEYIQNQPNISEDIKDFYRKRCLGPF